MNVSSLAAMVRNRLRREGIYSRSEYWDAKAAEYNGDAISMWPNNALNRLYHREQTDLISAWLGDLRGRLVLDVGCGTGRISRFLAALGATVVGVDFSEKSLEVARRLSGAGNPSYRRQSVFELEGGGAFDAVVCLGCLSVACRTPGQFVCAARRLRNSLKTGGVLLLIEPFHRGFLHRVLNMSLDECLEVLRRERFDIRRTAELHFWPMRLLLAYFPLPATLTAAGYGLGQMFLKMFNRLSAGDYKAVYAVAE